MKRVGLYLVIALFVVIVLGLPLFIGLKIGSIISKAWLGFSVF